MHNGVYLAYVCQKFISQPFALAGTFYQTGNVYKLNGSRHYALWLHQFGQFAQPFIGYVYLSHVGLNSAEAVIGGLCFGAVAYCIKQC